MSFANRGRVPDKWSSRILWLCALGSVVATICTAIVPRLMYAVSPNNGFYMVAVDRQTQNRAKAEAAAAAGDFDGEV